jgi:hypothetical protein
VTFDDLSLLPAQPEVLGRRGSGGLQGAQRLQAGIDHQLQIAVR